MTTTITNPDHAVAIKKYIQQRFLRSEKGYFCLLTGEGNLQTYQLIGILDKVSQKPDTELTGIPYETMRDVFRFDLGRKWDSYPMTNKTAYVVGGAPLIERHGILFINTWKPPKNTPKAGDISVFLTHLLLALGSQEKVDFVLDFLAHKYQHPTIKAPHALYLYGRQGMGKGTLKEVLQGVFGKSAVKYAGKASAVGSVLNWSASLFIADEIKITKHSEFYNEIKAYAVETELEDRLLYQNYATHDIPAQLILFSNHAPSFLEEDDRRFFVSEYDIGLEKTSEDYKEHFAEYWEWINSEYGLPALAWHLQTRDLSKYQLRSAPPMTAEKEKALSIVSDPIKGLILEMLEDNPDKLVFSETMFKTLKEDAGTAWKYQMTESGLTKHPKRITINGNLDWRWVRDSYSIVTTKGHPAQVKNDKTKQLMPMDSVLLSSWDWQYGENEEL